MKQQGTLKALRVIHSAMLLGQFLFAAIAFFLQYTGSFPSSLSSINQLMQVIAILLSFGGFFIGTSLFKKITEQLRDSSEAVKTKADGYRAASILQWALLEGPSLFCIICFLLVGNYAFLALSAALMLVFFMAAPSRLKVMMLLRLSEEEMEQF